MHEREDVIESVVTDSRVDLGDEVLALAARSERAAFLTLYDRYAERVERYVLARVQNRSDAEDVVSATFMQALAKIDTFDSTRGSFAGWLFGVARNAVNMHHRNHRPCQPNVAEEQPDNEMMPEDAAIQAEQTHAVRAAMKRLTEEQQDALALRYLADLPFAEVARQLGKSEGATKMLVNRGVRALRRYLEEQEQR